MNCDEIREKISCMLDNELSAEDSAAVTEHLSHCPECNRIYQAFQAVSVSMAQLEDVPEGFTESVMQNISTASPKHKRHSGFAYFASLAACLAVVLFAGSRLTSITKPAPESANTASVPHIEAQVDATEQETPDEQVVEDIDTNLEGIDMPDACDNRASGEVSTETYGLQAKAVDHTEIVPTPETKPAQSTPKPNPVPDSRTLADLLVRVEMADINLYRTTPDAEVTVKDKNGLNHILEIWYETSRIYCKDNTIREAYYAPLAPAELTGLLEKQNKPQK